MTGFKKWAKRLIAFGYFTSGLLILVVTRKNLKPIYRGFRYFLEHESYQITLNILRNNPQVHELLNTRYRDYEPVAWDQLQQMPSGSLGHEFAKFMKNPEVTPLEKLPEAKVEINPEIDYLRRRIRLTHDIHHVVCGFPASEIGEMGISAFYIAQINSPLNAMVLAVGFIKCTLKCPSRMHELMNTITEGWQQGLRARNLFGVKYEEMWMMPVSEIRKQLNIIPSGMDFISRTDAA